MTTVRIKCTRCTTTSTTVPDALLLEPVADDVSQNTAAIVNWICGGCSSLVNCPIGWPDFLNLVSAGALSVNEEDPRPPYPESAQDGPVWSSDDLLDLHALLLTRDWFSQLEATTGITTDPS
jgi:hypothetical protein